MQGNCSKVMFLNDLFEANKYVVKSHHGMYSTAKQTDDKLSSPEPCKDKTLNFVFNDSTGTVFVLIT